MLCIWVNIAGLENELLIETAFSAALSVIELLVVVPKVILVPSDSWWSPASPTIYVAFSEACVPLLFVGSTHYQ